MKYTIHMVGNAHIDPVWLWRWKEGLEAVRATYKQAVEFIKENRTFIFSAGQAATYKWIEDNDPKLFEEIARYVKKGRWDIVNGWWVQPDCNIPCGESFVRQALYGKKYFKEKFNADVRVGYNVDSFGHAASLPQILKKSGLDYYLFFRPDPEEKKLESRLFWWESQDGTRVLTVRPLFHYNTPGDKDGLLKKVSSVLADRFMDLEDDICLYGVGDHGGGPTRDEILAIKKFKQPGLELTFSTPGAFFNNAEKADKKITVLRDELQHHGRGCYTTLSWIKKANRQSEFLLMTAEKFATIAKLAGTGEYPGDIIEDCWRRVLFNQFHDILGGTSIPAAYEDCRKDYEYIFREGRRVLDWALDSICAKVNTSGKGKPLVLFNQYGWKRKETVEIAAENDGKACIVNSKSRKVVHQYDSARNKLVFTAEVPPLGYETYFVRPSKRTAKKSRLLKVFPTTIENKFYFLQINPKTGNIVHLYDKKSKLDVIAYGREGNEMLVFNDNGDAWGHGINSYSDIAGRFTVSGRPEVTEQGPVRATIRLKSSFMDSTVEQEISLCHDSARIDFRTKVGWHEKNSMLKVSFPLAVEAVKATYEIPYGNIMRYNSGEEEPGQKWIDVTGVARRRNRRFKYGASLINDCKYGFSVRENELHMSLIRSPLYAQTDSQKSESGAADHQCTDQGEHCFGYAFISHTGSWQKAQTARIACEFNNSLIVKEAGGHEGELPRSNSFLSVEPANLVDTVLKKAENSNEIILRFYETAGRGGKARIRFSGLNFSCGIRFKPHEIKTLRIDMDKKPFALRECNLIEE